MCGITGFVCVQACEKAALLAQIRRMADQLTHRGPDDSGTWVNPEVGVALGFRRLAILDLSSAGHQPMLSASGRYVMVFNGEVYNFRALRPELESKGHRFRGSSDTEVMLAAISERGLEAAVRRFVGMFAFAVWDQQEQVLHLIRDRLGIKPLYYGWIGRTFLFGSELKALRAHADFVPEIDRGALSLYLRYQYIPQPYSIYKGIQKLPPGFVLTVQPQRSDCLPRVRLHPYWSAKEIAEYGSAHPFKGSEQEAIERLDALLREAVRLCMIADVPLGAFLSGGVDSSTVVAMMQVQSSRPVKTFTIGFHEDGYNEAAHAKKVASHLGTDHTELYLTAQETLDVIPKLPHLFDEPFSDSSEIPTHLVSMLARRQVTVSLSGDGGDELFGGYNRYSWGRSIWRGVGWLPKSSRQVVAQALRSLSPEGWNRVIGALSSLLPSRLRIQLPGDKAHKLAAVLGAGSAEDFYGQLVSQWKNPKQVLLSAEEPATTLSNKAQWPALPSLSEQMMFLDLVTYLPDDILTKVDRASMAASLEVRVPLLDHRVVEFAAFLPLAMKIHNGKGKSLLRRILYRYVPQRLIERPKMGFGVPVGTWLRGPLRDWAEDLLSDEHLRRQSYFQPVTIRTLWAEHLAGNRDWGHFLWCVLIFQAWLAHWKGSRQGKRVEPCSDPAVNA